MFGERMTHSCETCIARWKNFENLTSEELRLVDDNRYEATFKPGEIIIKQGAPAANAVFLATGIGKVYIEGSDGRNFILGIYKSSNLLLGPGVHLTKSHSYTVSALTFVQACFVSFDILYSLIGKNPKFAHGMLEDLSMKTFNAHNRLLSITQKKMPGRLAEALLYFSEEIFGAEEYDILMSRQELGEMTNMAKESVVRILKEFETSGIITASCARIKILDKEKLRTISEHG